MMDTTFLIDLLDDLYENYPTDEKGSNTRISHNNEYLPTSLLNARKDIRTTPFLAGCHCCNNPVFLGIEVTWYREDTSVSLIEGQEVIYYWDDVPEKCRKIKEMMDNFSGGTS